MNSEFFDTCQAIRCEICGQLHEANSEDFISVHGNINIGRFGGVVGNNFDQDGRVNRVMCFCKSEKCMSELVSWFYMDDACVSVKVEELTPSMQELDAALEKL